MAMGFIAAVLGYWLKDALGLPEPLMLRIASSDFPVVWSIIGSALFVAVISFLTGRRRESGKTIRWTKKNFMNSSPGQKRTDSIRDGNT